MLSPKRLFSSSTRIFPLVALAALAAGAAISCGDDKGPRPAIIVSFVTYADRAQDPMPVGSTGRISLPKLDGAVNQDASGGTSVNSVFAGWSLDRDSGLVFMPGAAYPGSGRQTGDVTLHAVWLSPDKLKYITFKGNDDPRITGEDRKWGAPLERPFALPSGIFEKGSLSMNGWDQSPDAPANSPTYRDAQVIQSAEDFPDSVFAIWQTPVVQLFIEWHGRDTPRGSSGLTSLRARAAPGGSQQNATNALRNIEWKVIGATNRATTQTGRGHTLRVNVHPNEPAGAPLNVLEADGELTAIVTSRYPGVGPAIAILPVKGTRQVGEWRIVSSIQDSTFGITWNGELWGWGRNDNGQIGIGALSPYALGPQRIGTDSDWHSIGGGLEHSLGIRAVEDRDVKKDGGTLWVWGSNNFHRLGLGNALANGQNSRQLTPRQLGTEQDWILATGGAYASYGIRADGALYSWGGNSLGELGTGAAAGHIASAPTPVGSAAQIGQGAGWRFKSVSATASHAVAVREDGSLWAWGDNEHRQVSPSVSEAIIATPVEITHAGVTRWKDAHAGEHFTIALSEDGRAYSWGRNQRGQLGQGSGSDGPLGIAEVAGSHRWQYLAVGNHHTLGVPEGDGKLYTWGWNNYSQVAGSGNEAGTRRAPELFQPSGSGIELETTSWMFLNAGGWNSSAVEYDGKLWAWGSDYVGQTGQSNAQENSPEGGRPPMQVMKPE
ncbi:MAG: hypothetical protein FWE09_01830 [Treponema sp.]|nr:hypothetical protein [Treponema sp.]